MIGLQPDVGIEELSCQALQKNPRKQPVQVAFMGQNNVGSRQKIHNVMRVVEPVGGGQWRIHADESDGRARQLSRRFGFRIFPFNSQSRCLIVAPFIYEPI